MKRPVLTIPRAPRALPEHKTAAAKKQRDALRATTESHVYNNRSRNNLKRGAK